MHCSSISSPYLNITVGLPRFPNRLTTLHLRPEIPLIEIDAAINDSVFADACLAALLQNMRKTVEAA